MLGIYKIQLWLSLIAGKFANCQIKFIKNFFINFFCRSYSVNLTEAELTDPFAYKSFNHFFTRALQKDARTIVTEPNILVSPADAAIHSHGDIAEHIVAKGEEYSLANLCGGDPRFKQFVTGSQIVLYLAPHDYHRVHVPYNCVLQDMLYVPGKLFSVNPKHKKFNNSIFARNERLICFTETGFGNMAIILVAAMIVGQIATSWGGVVMPPHVRSAKHFRYSQGINLYKGDELGSFSLGSTVILLLEQKVNFNSELETGLCVQMGQALGKVS